MKYLNWEIAEYSKDDVAELVGSGIPNLVAEVLCARGITNPRRARKFIQAAQQELIDPMLMADMDKAVDRIERALRDGERIAIFGDYDVDGITALSMMVLYFRRLGVHAAIYIPDRIKEGYSLNKMALDRLKEQNIDLIITVDCGITAIKEVEYAKTLGIDIVITDHHECLDKIPDAAAVINPRRPDCNYPFKGLAGVGVAFKLICALNKNRDVDIEGFFVFAAIGTIADIVTLTEENRAIVQRGLNRMQSKANVGLRCLMEEAGVQRANSTKIGYVISPRINAAGRIGKVKESVMLFLTEDEAGARAIAKELCEYNKQRRVIEDNILQETIQMLGENYVEGEAIVLSGEDWHKGVIGIVASKLADQFHVPTMLISLEGKKGKASCRSYAGFNLHRALGNASEYLESFGGHMSAAGFMICKDNIPAFAENIKQQFREHIKDTCFEEKLHIDCVLEDARELTLPNLETLGQLEPFGNDNKRPIFCVCNAKLIMVKAVGNGKHTRMTVKIDGKTVNAIFFGSDPEEAGITKGDTVDIAFYPEINEFRGKRSVQMEIVDIKLCREMRMAEDEQLEAYRQFLCHQELKKSVALEAVPHREDFVHIWRYLNNNPTTGDCGLMCRLMSYRIGVKANLLQFLVCLEVFCELGLIDFTLDGRYLDIDIKHGHAKVDLKSSKILEEFYTESER